ncbi:C39 family peptidase [Lactobacillus sp. ESL0791]|uniref:C39 family peptidase n=1 Tax=Lactobacillus sp. ESL0791 TaxID=2983234 RepID=UPI0023FA4723|nr:C39 family peptidase [Lactobacillus sp. ESL0791]MDF7639734.1 C39 family peptidase [Lactobacillus sp. ESL0791]
MNKKVIGILAVIFTAGSFGLAQTVKADTAASSADSAATQKQDQSNESNVSQDQSDTSNQDQTSTGESSDTSADSNAADSNTAPTNDSNNPTKDNKKKPTPAKPVKKPPLKEGWVKHKQKTYYYKANKKVKGLMKIGEHHYLFNKAGVMLKGLRKTPHKSTYSYYRNNGQRSEKSIGTKKAFYWIKKGKITGIKNKAKVICQRPELPTGCEMTAVTMMLNFAGKKVSKFTVAQKTPRNSNPDKGFIGSPYQKYPGGYWVTPNGIKGVVKHYLGKAKVLTGSGLMAVEKKLLHSHLVVAWVSGVDGFSNHALALTGYHNGWIYYNDPWTGKKASMSQASFINHWSGDAYRALSY